MRMGGPACRVWCHAMIVITEDTALERPAGEFLPTRPYRRHSCKPMSSELRMPSPTTSCLSGTVVRVCPWLLVNAAAAASHDRGPLLWTCMERTHRSCRLGPMPSCSALASPDPDAEALSSDP